MSLDKASIRQTILQKRDALSRIEIKKRSVVISNQIRASQLYQSATTVGLYYPFRNEVDILSICDFNYKKTYCFPKYTQNGYIMVSVRSLSDFEPGAFGILEPISSEIFPTSDIDVWYVPGVAFTLSGHRVGYGKGIYDRLLKDYSHEKIGVCFQEQIVSDDSFSDPWDIPLDSIIYS